MTGLVSDPIPLEPDRSLADYPTASVWTGQEPGGTSNYAAEALATAIGPRGQQLDPQQANDLYGIPGQLKFDAPVDDQMASGQYMAKRAELVRGTEAALDPQGFMTKAERLGAGFVAGAADPLNIAASFLPGVGEERMAGWLAHVGLDSSTLLGRTAIRAAVGATRGAVGQAALEPLQWARAQSLQDDYGPVNVLSDLAFGAALGGGLHVVVGALGGDHLGDGFTGSPEGKLAAADLETREGALRTSLSQIMDGNPVEVGPVFDAAAIHAQGAENFGLAPDEFATRLDAMSASIRQRGDDAVAAIKAAVGAPPLPDTPEAVAAMDTPPMPPDDAANQARILGIKRAPRQPKTLLQFIASKGGVRDEGGELRAMDLHQAKTGFQPGFGPVVRARGLHPDAMRDLAESAGFLKRRSEHETTTMSDLYEAISAEIKSGRDYGHAAEPIYDPDYETHLRDLAARHDADDLSEEGQLDHFTELAARHLPEDIGSEGRHDEFDIPWEDLSESGHDAPGSEAGGGAPDPGRAGAEDGSPAEGAGREHPEQAGERRSLDSGGQSVLPGAERISDKAFAERQMAGGKKATVAQKPADEGLFDTAARDQRELFDPEMQAADAQAAKADLLASAYDAAAGCMGSH